MEYLFRQPQAGGPDFSEMFVLMVLFFAIPQRLAALLLGADRPLPPTRWARYAPVRAAYPQLHPLAPVPTPTPRLTI